MSKGISKVLVGKLKEIFGSSESEALGCDQNCLTVHAQTNLDLISRLDKIPNFITESRYFSVYFEVHPVFLTDVLLTHPLVP
jgi:hypothetical protein